MRHPRRITAAMWRRPWSYPACDRGQAAGSGGGEGAGKGRNEAKLQGVVAEVRAG